MKTIIRNTAAALLVTAFASSAFAMSASSQSVRDSLAGSSLDAHNVQISVRDGVVTLSGNVNDNLTRIRAERIVKNTEGVTGVVNLITGN